MKTAKQLREEISALCDRVTAIAKLAEVENRDLSTEETAEIDAIQGVGENDGQINALKAQLTRAEKLEKIQASLAADKGAKKIEGAIDEDGIKAFKVPAKARSMGVLKNYSNQDDAYADGMFYASVLGSGPFARKARQWCKEHGVIKNTMTTGDNTKGGFIVPEPLEARIIVLREKFGLFRQYAMQYTMSDAVTIIPKLQTEITAYFVGEGDPTNSLNAVTPSDIALAQIKLEARKLATMTVISSELSEDAIINIADVLTGSIAFKLARTEDDCGFNGDGTSTYGNIVGLSGALAAGSTYTATSRTTFSALTMNDFETALGQRKMWGDDPAWYISQVGWANSMQRLMDAYSGNTITTLANGSIGLSFLGFPVRISQVLNSATTGTTGTVACYFGDLRNGVYMGTRRGLDVQTDKSIYFNYDAIAVRSTQRFDINVHDRGDASTAGGIIKVVFG